MTMNFYRELHYYEVLEVDDELVDGDIIVTDGNFVIKNGDDWLNCYGDISNDGFSPHRYLDDTPANRCSLMFNIISKNEIKINYENVLKKFIFQYEYYHSMFIKKDSKDNCKSYRKEQADDIKIALEEYNKIRELNLNIYNLIKDE